MLESTRRVDTVVLDKTGTVTTGQMTLVDVVTAPGGPRRELLRLAGAVEHASEHPIAARHRRGAPATASAASSRRRLASGLPGLGVRGVVEFAPSGSASAAWSDGHAVRVGRAGCWPDRTADAAGRAGERADAGRGGGRTAVLAGWDGEVRGGARGRRHGQADRARGGGRAARAGAARRCC